MQRNGDFEQVASGEPDTINYTIDEIKALAIGRFGVTPLEAARMTLYEFQLYNLAYQVKEEKRLDTIHTLAWKNQEVQATKGSGKTTRPVFKQLKDFYDSEKIHNQIFANTKQTRSKEKAKTMNDILGKNYKPLKEGQEKGG